MVLKRFDTWVCPDISEILNIPEIFNILDNPNIPTIPEITIII